MKEVQDILGGGMIVRVLTRNKCFVLQHSNSTVLIALSYLPFTSPTVLTFNLNLKRFVHEGYDWMECRTLSFTNKQGTFVLLLNVVNKCKGSLILQLNHVMHK